MELTAVDVGSSLADGTGVKVTQLLFEGKYASFTCKTEPPD